MNTKIKVYEKRPSNFFPKVEVAAIYVNVKGEILLLELASKKEEAGAWGVPAGKLELHEIPMNAAKRELFEETGIEVGLEKLRSLGALYISKPDIDYTYHLFGVNLNVQPDVYLSDEHVSYKWVVPGEAKTLRLMDGASYAMDAYLKSVL